MIERAAFTRRTIQSAGANDVTSWGIAVEAPIEIALNGTPWTVMLATPADVEDLAVGIAVTERVLLEPTAIEAMTVSEFLHDISVNITVPEHALDASAMRARSLLGSTACGLCGLESLAALRPRLESATNNISGDRLDDAPHRTANTNANTNMRVADIANDAIQAAFTALPSQQPLNNATHSVHAAAWCLPNGEIVCVREDVGRHNALDKLVGALARTLLAREPGFIVMTSRCSYELVYKAAAAGASLLATISAPTTLALEWSAALSVPLACCGPKRQIVRFPPETAYAG